MGEAWAQWHRREACFLQKGDHVAESLSDVRTSWILTGEEKGVLWILLGVQERVVDDMVTFLKKPCFQDRIKRVAGADYSRRTSLERTLCQSHG